jgi:predicted DNA-binding transcriptional regulator AlpA
MFLSINGACSFLGLKRSKISKYIKQGVFPESVKTDTRMQFWDRAVLTLWVEPQKPVKVKVHKERKPVAPKYRDGENTWSGRGIMAKWLKTHISNGRSIDEFKV